ncbi:MAG: hypothetical protein HY695_09140 [Deltaproteobacteria bacterium]|nr:hypothetical protein [Deltaproteobacteria bacterium]
MGLDLPPGVALIAKAILDEIDQVLAAGYGFTDKELDFIPSASLRAGPSMKLRAGNYDIKYRMGREAKNECINDASLIRLVSR